MIYDEILTPFVNEDEVEEEKEEEKEEEEGGEVKEKVDNSDDINYFKSNNRI